MITNGGTTPAHDTGRKPAAIAITRTSMPCRVATVAPPSVRPNMMDSRETGATIVSFRNPNWRSQITCMPLKIEVKMIDMPMMPGAMNSR